MTVLVTSKNGEDPIKKEGARVATTLNIDFSNRQGQLTPQSWVESGRNGNSSKMFFYYLNFISETTLHKHIQLQ